METSILIEGFGKSFLGLTVFSDPVRKKKHVGVCRVKRFFFRPFRKDAMENRILRSFFKEGT